MAVFITGYLHRLTTKNFASSFYRILTLPPVMPGSFLARDTEQGNPGANHVRVAWVAPLQDCIEAAKRLRAFGEELLHKHQH